MMIPADELSDILRIPAGQLLELAAQYRLPFYFALQFVLRRSYRHRRVEPGFNLAAQPAAMRPVLICGTCWKRAKLVDVATKLTWKRTAKGWRLHAGAGPPVRATGDSIKPQAAESD